MFVRIIITITVVFYGLKSNLFANEQKPLYPNVYVDNCQNVLFQRSADPEIFHSQVGEDAILASVFSKEIGEGKGFYIDVGAHEPKAINVSYYFYKKGWKGISIEPIKRYFDKLQSIRPNDINLNILVGKEDGEETLNEVVPKKGQEWASALSTTKKDQKEALEKQNYKMTSYKVPVTTMNKVFEKHVPKDQDVHFLKIDVEGSEKDVLLGLDLKKHRPFVICIEVMSPGAIDGSKEWGSILCDADYTLVLFDGLNNYYVRKESPDIIARFAYTADLLNFLRQIATPNEPVKEPSKPGFLKRIRNFIRSVF
jgi:FkbM family methyltransferase